MIIVPFAQTHGDWLSKQITYFILKQKEEDFNIILCHTSFSMSAAEGLESCAHATRYLFADSIFSYSFV